jgi:8-oxo-dGTP pyrophosphatase MutT (NUDIX family)
MGRVEYPNDPAAPRPNSLVPAAGVLAVDDAGRLLLLLQRRRDTGQWAIPMGKQELGETVAQCAVRETLEETGVQVEVTGLLGIYSDPGHIMAYTDGEVRQEYEVILTGRPVSGEPTANDEASAAGWFALEDLAALDIHPTQWRQLRDSIDDTAPHVDKARPLCDRGGVDDNSITDARRDAAASTDALPAVPAWKASLRAAADEAYDRNPGGLPDSETVARIRRRLYPS